MPDDDFERGFPLLIQALNQAGIPEQGESRPKAPFAGPTVYWQNTNADIEVVFSCVHPGSGRLKCSVSLGHLAIQTAQSFKDDQEVIDALVDALNYLKSALS